MSLLNAKQLSALRTAFICIGSIVVQPLTAFADTLNTFTPNTIADPAKVNANFQYLLEQIQQLSGQINGPDSLSSKVSRISQQLGDVVVVDCDADPNALLNAIANKATNIEVVRGTCNANTQPDIEAEIYEIGDLKISGVGSPKPTLLTSIVGGKAGYLGGRGGRLELNNVSLRGGILSVGSESTLSISDTDIDCNNQNNVALTVYGASGSIRGLTVNNCKIVGWLGSAASLLVQRSTINLISPTPTSVGFSLVNGSVLELEDSSILGTTTSSSALSFPVIVNSESHFGVTGSIIDGGGGSFIGVNNGGAMTFNGAKVGGEVVQNSLLRTMVGLAGASRFTANRTTFEDVNIADFGPYTLEDSATTVYLSSDTNFTHKNLSVGAGRQVQLAGAWLGDNLRAWVGQAGVVSVRNSIRGSDGANTIVKNDFRFTYDGDESGRGFDLDSTLRVQHVGDLTYFQEQGFFDGACKFSYSMTPITSDTNYPMVWQCQKQ